MEELGGRDYRRISPDSGSLFQTFPKDNLQKSLKGQFNDSVWEHLAGTTSEPFVADSKGQIAIKVIDERGNELMRVLNVAEAE